MSLRRWEAIRFYKDSVAPDPPTQRCDGPMGGDRSGAFASSYSEASGLAAAGRAGPSGAERSRSERSAQGEQVQQIPPSSDRAEATARGSAG